MPALRPATDRFNEKVDRSGACWTWTGARDPKGYGRFNLDGRSAPAHRAAYTLFCGAIPPGQMVLHRCDNPPCVRPEHLFLGTARDNTADMLAKQREARGSRCGTAKLTEQDVRAIRASRESCSALAAQYGVEFSNVARIRRGETWRHV